MSDDTGKISDGYHTFDELYDHRITLFIAVCRLWHFHCAPTVFKTVDGQVRNAWRSKLHSDGSSYDGWFVLGLMKSKGDQITYHLPLLRWDETDFAETLDTAPEFDGHTAADVLQRLKDLV